METPSQPVPLPASKPKKWVWLTAFGALSLLCICACVAVPIIAVINDPTYLNLFKTGNPKVNIEAGTYEGTIYTAPDGNFSCNFEDIMAPGFNPILEAQEDSTNGTGSAVASDDLGQRYGVEFFISSSAFTSEDRQDSLQEVLETIVLKARGANAEVVHQEFLVGDILFVILNNPGGSFLSFTQNGGDPQPGDSWEGYYIFAVGGRFYFVYYYSTPAPGFDQTLDNEFLRLRVDEFYRGCQFQP